MQTVNQLTVKIRSLNSSTQTLLKCVNYLLIVRAVGQRPPTQTEIASLPEMEALQGLLSKCICAKRREKVHPVLTVRINLNTTLTHNPVT